MQMVYEHERKNLHSTGKSQIFLITGTLNSEKKIGYQAFRFNIYKAPSAQFQNIRAVASCLVDHYYQVNTHNGTPLGLQELGILLFYH